MFRSYLKFAWRNILRNKTFSLINIVGLTSGLCCFLLIALYIVDEATFDRFHENRDNIYRVVEQRTSPEGKESSLGSTAFQLSASAKSDFQEVKETVRLTVLGRVNVGTLENKNVFYEDFWISNPDFLRTFDFKLQQGNRLTALSAPHTVVVTEKTALKLFNTTAVVGKSLTVERDSTPYLITGVLENFPVNSQFSFNLLFSELSITTDARFEQWVNNDWSSNNFYTYLLLDEKASPRAVEGKLNSLVAVNRPPDVSEKSSFVLQPLKEIHFNSEGIEGNIGKTGNITYIYVFSIIALFVLLVACINYMNLSTALFSRRAKEIGVRKISGASRSRLAGQFLAESYLMTLLAFVLAFLLIRLLLPAFNAFTEKALNLGFDTDSRIWLGLVLVIVLVGGLSGLYPAVYQSRLKPLELFKNKLPVGKENISIRRFLVVFQFAVSIIMILATLVVYLQLQYIDTKDMGFNKSQLLVIDINSGKVRQGAETIKNEFVRLPQVSSVSVSSRVPGEWKNLPKVKVKQATTPSLAVSDMFFLAVDDQFLPTFEIALLKGRNFIPGSSADSSSIMLNETAARELGITEPSEQLIQIPAAVFGGSPEPLSEPYRARVVGIVKDFNFQSLREPLAPMVLGYQKNPVHSIDYFTVRVAPGGVAATLKQLEAVMQQIDQHHLFEYHFLDNQWDMFYREDQIRETIFLIGAALAILIGCLGLFGLATFAAEQRRKEVGIRKVLGASVSSIVLMLSKDFLKLVLLAALIAFPVGWYAMHQWLQDFAYRISLSWWIFGLAGLGALLIAFITVSFKTIKAALANPVNNLRTE
ncbi:antimicrobial peptide ABC transporter permease [Flammeovirgaceae bacterium 311]|nr:antimicrobial peptide ABC transporter permease [Flammeovirgaceae bacterium 311]